MAIERSLNDKMIDIDEVITVDTVYKMDYACNGYTVQITPDGGSATVFVSNDGINFIKWASGDVTVSTIDRSYPVEYLKVDLISASSVRVAIRGY